jgi:hypothetical protein
MTFVRQVSFYPPLTRRSLPAIRVAGLADLYFGHLDLSFDFAQDGEHVEPFRISIFGFRIYIGILGGSLMVTEVQILANRIELRYAQYERRATSDKRLIIPIIISFCARHNLPLA